VRDFLDPVNLLVRMPVVLLALTLHEFAHAYMAYRMGDPTAMREGRCSLNPLAHLDLIGTLCIMFGPIGWAKPVPVNPMNFRHPLRDEMLVSAAGPVSNLIQAVFFGLLLRVLFRGGMMSGLISDQWATLLFVMFGSALIVNCGLAIFNMIPAFPLDGFHVTRYFLSPPSRRTLDDMAPYGTYIILGLVMLPMLVPGFSPLSRIIHYPVLVVWTLVAGLPSWSCPI